MGVQRAVPSAFFSRAVAGGASRKRRLTGRSLEKTTGGIKISNRLYGVYGA
jgi:hypothetical protein